VNAQEQMMNTRMKKTLATRITLAVLLAGLAASGAALAKPAHKRDYRDSFPDRAWVVASTPIYEDVNQPRQECWTEQVGYQPVAGGRSYAGAVLGGIVGGIVGNQVGKGTGRYVATAVGAATGAIVGDNIDNDRHVAGRAQAEPRYEQRCRSVDQWERRLVGYNVTYRYQGRDYTAVMPHDPGRSVRINVQVSLAE
jgi:uncharacterized protein YcfJ